MSFRKFVILTLGRTGSTILNKLLECHVQIAAYREVFNMNYDPSAATVPERSEVLRYWLSELDAAKRERPLDLTNIGSMSEAEILDDVLWGSGYSAAVRVVGFKLLDYQMRYIETFHGLFRALRQRLPEVHVIFNDRENLLRLHLSHELAKRVNQWHAFSASERRPRPRIRFEPDQLGKQLANWERTRENLMAVAGLSPRVYAVSYEQLVRDQSLHWEKLQEFLGVEYEEAGAVRFVKMENRNLRDAIENYGDLKYFFAGTRFSRYFDE